MEFGALKTLSDLDIEVKEKEIVSVIGPNGAGKTTLFNIVTGLYRPTSGTVLLGEVDAGLIYRTDAIASPNVDAVEFPEAKSFSTTYSAVKLSSSQKNLETRDAFLDYLSSSRAVAILLNAGFGKA